MPDMEFPSVSLVATDPGASPEQLEAAVARPIENAISTIGSVRHVSTTINDSVVTIMIEFTYEKQTEQAVLDVRDAVSRSEEHTSELQSLMRTSYAVFCLKKKINTIHLTKPTASA